MDVADILVSYLLRSKIIVNETKKKTVPLEQKYTLYDIPVKAYAPRGRLLHRKARNRRAELVEDENMGSPEQVQPHSTGNSRQLKRTYAVSGQ